MLHDDAPGIAYINPYPRTPASAFDPRQRPPLVSAHSSHSAHSLDSTVLPEAVPRRLVQPQPTPPPPHPAFNPAIAAAGVPGVMYIERRHSGDDDMGTEGSSFLAHGGPPPTNRMSSGSSEDIPRRADITNGWGGLKRGQACAFCRRRKLRCSGERPACSSCVKYHKSCEYTPAPQDFAQRRPSDHFVHQGMTLPSVPPLFLGLPPGVRPPLLQRPPSQSYSAPPISPAYTPIEGYGMDPRVRSAPQAHAHFTTGQASTFGGPLMSSAELSSGGDAHINTASYQQLPLSAGANAYTSTTANSYDAVPQWLTPQGTSTADIDLSYLSGPFSSSYTMASDDLSGAGVNTASEPAMPTAPTSSVPMGPPLSLPSAPTQPVDPFYLSTLPELSNNAGPSRKPSLIQTPHESPYSSSVSQPTPDASAGGSTPSSAAVPAPAVKNMYRETPALHYARDSASLEGLTERLGEFLFSPTESVVKEESAWAKRKQTGERKQTKQSRADFDPAQDKALQFVPLSSRLPLEMRGVLLDCFLMHSSMFFQMNIPRFRHRLTFTDRRSPSPALLNAMYLWATRMSNSPRSNNMEADFFHDACRFLDLSTSTVDRLIDAVRAAMLLAAYSYSSGRHHEGWCISGIAVRLVLSCGLHKIKSTVFAPDAGKQNPFLRSKVFLLPPPEDAIELGERIHAFWAVFAIDRCGALATGYPSGFNDCDITTPFPKDMADIASNNVTQQDNVTVADLYRGLAVRANTDIHYWVKSVTVLERASKLLFRDPEPDSPFQLAWDHYNQAVLHDPSTLPPSAHLEQPRYRVPRAYDEARLGLSHIVTSMGDSGIFPVDRRRQAEQAGLPEVEISYNVIMLHHLLAAIEMVLHDVNNMDAENVEALAGARKSVALFKHLPQLPFTDVDAFQVLVWSMTAKVLIKEVHRLNLAYDTAGALAAGQDADVIIDEMTRIGQTMHLARTQAKAVRELKQASFDSVLPGGNGELPLFKDFDFNFMFPQAAGDGLAGMDGLM